MKAINENELTKEILSHGPVQAFRIVKSIGGWIFKKIINRILSMLLPMLVPYIGAILVVVLLFGFVFGVLFVLPRYMAESASIPVIYSWGKGDLWTSNQDIELQKKYRKLNYDWLQQFRSYDTLAYQHPDKISGNAANEHATVSSVWGSYMATIFTNPFTMPNNNVYDNIFQAKAEKYKLDVNLIKSVAFAESSFNPRSISKYGCLGLMQLSEAKIAEYGIDDPFNPEENIDGGARYLSELLARFNNNLELALAAYNAGPGAVIEYNGVPPYPETKSYIAKVMALYQGGEYATPTLNAGSNIVAEQDQARPHSVPWSLMAAIDRVVGDPIINGKHGPETEEGKGRIPDPEKRFKELEPTLQWKDFQLYYHHQWVEKTDTGSITYTEEYTHNIKLLVSANTYEANYSYTWKEKVIENGDGDNYTRIVIPELAGTERSGPYYERLKNIMASYGLEKTSNVELVLRLAMNMDPEFNINANLTSSLLELTGNTEQREYQGGSGELAWPLNGEITSPYGYRVHPVTGQVTFHSGIDIGVPSGTEVHAAGDGLVVFVGNNGGYGKCVMVDHGTYRTLYGHLGSFNVRDGQIVKKGDVIALSDNTGVSTGPHLHFEVRTGTNKTDFINPMTILK